MATTKKTTKTSPKKSTGRKLGRGLGSLIQVPVELSKSARKTESSVSSGSISVDEPGMEAGPENGASRQGIDEIRTDQISPNPRQPRETFDQEALDQLAGSIQSAGLMQPIVVRRTGGGFELIAGERRWRAARQIGLELIPAVIRDVSDQEAAELALIENLQREDLNPMERAMALRRLADEFSLTHEQIAKEVGLDRTTVSNLLRISDLDDTTAAALRVEQISLGHAKALLGCTDLKLRHVLLGNTVRNEWSVRQLESAVRDAMDPRTGPGTSTRKGGVSKSHVQALEKAIGDQIGTRVQITRGAKPGSGKMSLSFYSNDQFEGLCQRLGVSVDTDALE
ncbi:MAG: chromosome partitioning protein ParB [Phycisphaerae bacterium]|nr:chromosome partitioning protein ParB [Phycisphaerae bacterium]